MYIFVHTLSAHQRDEISGRRYILLKLGICKCYLSESESSDLNQGEMMRQMFHVNGLYQHIRKRCVIYKRLTWVSVVIIIFWEGFARLP